MDSQQNTQNIDSATLNNFDTRQCDSDDTVSYDASFDSDSYDDTAPAMPYNAPTPIPTPSWRELPLDSPKTQIVPPSEPVPLILLDYTTHSHVLLGDFKDQYADFRHKFLVPADWCIFTPRMHVGPGWCFRLDRFEEMTTELAKAGIPYMTTDEYFHKGKARTTKAWVPKARAEAKPKDAVEAKLITV